MGRATYGIGVAITVRQVIYDNLNKHVRALSGICEVFFQLGNLCNDVEPCEGGNVLNSEDFGLQSSIRDQCGSSDDLVSVEGRKIDLSKIS